MRTRRPEPHTLAGAYALDALTRADRVRFERHLARCEQCAREVRGMAAATAALAAAVAAEPPAELMQRAPASCPPHAKHVSAVAGPTRGSSPGPPARLQASGAREDRGRLRYLQAKHPEIEVGSVHQVQAVSSHVTPSRHSAVRNPVVAT